MLPAFGEFWPKIHPKVVCFCYYENISKFKTADPILIKLAQYVYHLQKFHLLKTEGVNQTKGKRRHIHTKKCLEFMKILTLISLKNSL